MKPDEISSSLGGTPLLQQRPMAVAPNSIEDSKPKEAATQIIRNKIDTLFADKQMLSDQSSTQLEDTNPYDRVHSDHVEPPTNDWQKYHTAWQTYYQKYYEGYYTHHLNKAKQTLLEEKTKDNKPSSDKKAVFELRQQLLDKIKESATKARKSRHFIPILSGFLVVLLLLFLQYNSLLIGSVMAYVSPGHIDPQNIVIDPSTDIVVSPEPRLIIPKINVDVPVLYDVGNDYDSQMAAMAKGVAHFAIPGASSHPGQVGNTVLAGHSSNDLFDTGNYKFIFAQLDKLNIGDTVYANYNSKRYTYTVTKKEVVGPNDVNKLVYTTTKPILTLLTCTPVGTAISRLLVTAEQVSPDPNQSVAAPTNSQPSNKKIPGNQPTLLERLFGIKN